MHRSSLLRWTLSTGLALTCALAPGPADAQTIAQATRGMEKRDGYLPLYWDAKKGRLLLEIPRPGEDFLYLTSLATGLGANELGLDRGMIGDEYIARFERVGPRVLFVLRNPGFRALSENEALVRSVEESFPTSTVAAFELVAEEGGRLLVDVTPYVLTDVMDVAGRLRRGDQGEFRVDRERSAVYLPRTKAFPENTEIEVSLTFTSERPGPLVREHAPDGRAITLRQHHSFVRLPDPPMRPRRFDPRIGIFPVTFYDFAEGFDGDYVKRYIRRHRLEKKDPDAPISEPVKPIVYYMDRGIPEPYRSAFREGALWFNKVFEAAGFRNAFRVEDMPPGMDPLDARYHVIQWIHRTDPGSSIGPSFVDPRTGEIIKAAVRMDSHRSLVDYDIWAGVQPAIEAADPWLEPGWAAWLASFDPEVTAEEFTMARRRQHAAHEVGHTLGLAHNFVAASYGRASVMDYPAPLIRLVDGRLDLREAYRPGPGAYDSIAIRYAYTPFPPEQEDEGLRAIVEEAIAKGIKFITNPDEGPSSSYPEATTWVNGDDMVAELARVMEVRRFLIDRFDERAIPPGEPMYTLVKRFTTVYLHHRFTLGAAIKAIGGMEFRYAVRGDGVPPTRVVEPERQRRALELLLDAVEPRELAIPERVLRLFAPRPFGYAREPRALGSKAEPAFDPVSAARTLATMVIGGILAPERAARVVAFAMRDPRQPTFEEVLGRMVERIWGREGAYRSERARDAAVLRRVVQRALVDECIRLASNPDATVEARAGAEWALRRIAGIAESHRPAGPEEAAHLELVVADVRRFLERREPAAPRLEPVPPPPGTPIGGAAARP